MKLKAAVYVHRVHTDVSPHMEAIAHGLRRCGVEVLPFEGSPDDTADFCVAWGMRKAERCQKAGYKGPMLIVERGYIGNRMEWTSLGWDGLNGHARHNEVWDTHRFKRNFSHLLKPWQTGKRGGYALIMGQVIGDMSLSNVDILPWYSDIAVKLWNEGWDVKFRPHPESDRRGHDRPKLPFAQVVEGSLGEALSGAGLVVAWNSNSLVDAVLAGVPIYAGDRGSMVFELSSRDFRPIYPDREAVLNHIACVQWSLTELSTGKAWEVVKTAMSAA